MVELRMEDPRNSEQLREMFGNLGLCPPFDHADDDHCRIVDEAGNTLCVVDVDRELPDEQAVALATLIVLCVNTCTGFQAVPPPAKDGGQADD